MNSPILLPVVALILWTMVMWAWMYATRIPAIIKMRIKLNPQALRGEQMNQLPAEVRWKADNYNHLMEQPTIFYAIVIVLVIIGVGDGVNLWLAWTYVGIRVAHSLVQSIVNIIELRFILFFISSLVLISLILSALRELI
jgi:hypothetical protein